MSSEKKYFFCLLTLSAESYILIAVRNNNHNITYIAMLNKEQLKKDQQKVIRFHEITAWAWKRYCAAVAARIEAAAFHKYMNI